ncbi:MAG TPA: carbon monoxide dehydrogenase subunit G [Anaerolineales bacterium]|nr:carbon monoxide dehydrogenase subunit G [Anaerolineales bacterium]
MHLEGTVEIAAPRERAWQFLTDPQAVSRCTPGVESLEVLEPGKRFRSVASLGLGSIKTRFTVVVEWVELTPPESAHARAHGTAPGSTADVEAQMVLTERGPSTTELRWTAEVTILGTIASLASRMMGGVTQKLSAQFFECVKKNIEAA